MNEYNFKVDFSKGKISSNLKKLVRNDYNTTKLNFTFDKEGRVLFKMLYPDGSQYVTQIENNELVFGPGILNQEGDYEVEVALYTEDGRLTDYATKSFEVRSELVDTDELIKPDDRVPVLDALINEVNQIKSSVDAGEFDGTDGITPNISVGEITTLAAEEDAQIIQTGTLENPVFNFAIPRGLKGEPGPQGEIGPEGPQGPQGEIGPVGPNGGLSEEEVKEIVNADYVSKEDFNNTIGDIETILKSLTTLDTSLLLKDVENTNLSGKTLTVDFGSYTSDELLKSIGVKDVNGGMTAETMTQFAVIGSDENGEQLDNSAMIMGMTGTMMQIFGLDASVDNFAADDFYLIATDINFGAVTPIANLSTLIIYNDYTFPFGLSDYNSVNGTTTGSTGETPIADDSIIWNCLKVVE